MFIPISTWIHINKYTIYPTIVLVIVDHLFRWSRSVLFVVNGFSCDWLDKHRNGILFSEGWGDIWKYLGWQYRKDSMHDIFDDLPILLLLFQEHLCKYVAKSPANVSNCLRKNLQLFRVALMWSMYCLYWPPASLSPDPSPPKKAQAGCGETLSSQFSRMRMTWSVHCSCQSIS